MTVAATPPTAGRLSSPQIGASVALLGLDALALKVIRTLEDAGILTLLLKGPVTGWWLYDQPTDHIYRDIDLLVSPRDYRRAGQAIAAMGFTDYHSTVLGIYRPSHEQAWLSPVGSIDLHMSLAGIPGRTRTRAWDVIWHSSETYHLHGHEIRVTGEAARSLFLALHAAHLASGESARRDLNRGLSVLPPEIWRRAADLAAQIDATPCFAAGLMRSSEGAQVAEALGIAGVSTTYSTLAWRGGLPEAFALAELLDLPKRWWWSEILDWGSAARPPSRADLYRRRLRVLGRLPRAVHQVRAAYRASTSPTNSQ